MLKPRRFETPTKITFYTLDEKGHFNKMQTFKKPDNKSTSKPLPIIQVPFMFNESNPEYSL